MKRTVLLSLFILLFAAFQSNAQVFVGGGFGINTGKSKSTYGSTTSNGDKTLDLNFTPKVGFFLGENLAIGTGFGIGLSKATTPADASETGEEEVYKTTSWAFAPFVRYYFARAGEFSFFGEGAVAIGGGKSKHTVGSTTNEGPKLFTVVVGVAPCMSYNLSKKVALEASIGSIGYASATSKQTYGGEDYKDTSSGFGLNMDLDNISFGAIIKF
jgi:hypothetical protein